MILAIDPGKDKCGLAIVDEQGLVLEQRISERKELANLVYFYKNRFEISTIVVGRGTYHKEIEKEVSRLDLKANLIFVTEKYSTLEARKRYWKENPPPGLLKIIPAPFRLPPRPVDDYSAVILAERYLKKIK